ncbi:hypothetical protein BGZ94_002556 [Podila epigama]|nr:hypothetical protein BGZ94_002556 [Podila epigama]
MLVQRNTILALLALLSSATLTLAWTNKNLQNWDKGWSQNIFGEPLDPKTACDGKPCTKFALTKPVVPRMNNRNSKFCKASATDDDAFTCNHVPNNATLVSNEEFKKLFRFRLVDPNFRDAPSFRKVLRPIRHFRKAASGLSGRIAGTANAIDAALNLWTESCGGGSDSGYDNPFFDYWKYVPSASKADIWFYIAPSKVCDQPAALACAFFPHQYPNRRTTILIDNAKLSRKNTNGAILTMAHEIGHVLGLAHEAQNDHRKVWLASNYDIESIMKPNFADLRDISVSDCLAMDYYAKGFPEPTSCRVVKGKGKVCTKVALKTVSPRANKVNFGEDYHEPKHGGRDELLKDSDDGTCLGNDLSQYVMVHPPEDSNRKFGWVSLGFTLSQCTAIRLTSDPNYFYAMQSDGNFVGYNSKTGKVISYTGSNGRGTKGNYNILFQEDGNLVIYDKKGHPIWNTGTYFGADNNFRLDPAYWAFHDGHFTIQDSGGRTFWGTGTYYVYDNVSIELKGSPFCLDAGGSAPGTGAILYRCNGGANQKWSILSNGMIQNKKSDNSAFGTSNGNPVIVYNCQDGFTNQIWHFRSDDTILNHPAKMCIDNSYNARNDGNKIHMWQCNSGGAQQWVIKP